MKRILLAVTFAALLLSCGKPISSENTLENPRFVQYAGQLVPQNGTLQYVEMTESGLYVAAMPGGTKGGPVGELLKYYTGTYTVSGDVYSLGSFGTLQFSNTASGEVDLTYTIGGTTETVKAKLTKATTTGDPCVHNERFDCQRGIHGLQFQRHCGLLQKERLRDRR